MYFRRRLTTYQMMLAPVISVAKNKGKSVGVIQHYAIGVTSRYVQEKQEGYYTLDGQLSHPK